MQQEKKVFGRPTKYRESMPEIAYKVLEGGGSLTQVMAELDVVHDTFNRWRRDKEKAEFSSAIERGLVKAKAWWEGTGQGNLHNPKFQTILWSMNMRNRHGYSEKPKIVIDFENAETPTDMLKCIMKKMSGDGLTCEGISALASLTNAISSCQERTETIHLVEKYENQEKGIV